MSTAATPLVYVLMGSRSDWEVMSEASKMLDELGVPHDVRILSAHRTPAEVSDHIGGAEAAGVQVIIAAAGGAAHLAGACAAHTVLPVLGVPITSGLNGLDSLLSIVQMPAGVPVGTLAVGKAGAVNAALLATQILGAKYPGYREQVRQYRARQTARVLSEGDPRKG